MAAKKKNTATSAPTSSAVAEMPADEVVPVQEKPSIPTRGRKYRISPTGDVYVMRAVGQNDPNGMPAGALVPVPNISNFETRTEALAWVTNSGDILSGMKIAIIRVHDIADIVTETITVPKVNMVKKTIANKSVTEAE